MIFLGPLEQILGSKSHFLSGKKFEIMSDFIGAFWEIWLDMVLCTSFFGAFRAHFRIKIRLVINQNIRDNAWYYSCILGDLAQYRLNTSFFGAFFLCWGGGGLNHHLSANRVGKNGQYYRYVSRRRKYNGKSDFTKKLHNSLYL